MPATITSTEVTVQIKPGAEFDVERPGVARNPRMQVDLVEVVVQDGHPVEVTLRGRAYKGDGTLGGVRAVAEVWPSPHTLPSPDEAGSFVPFTTLPSTLQVVVNEVFEKFDQ